MPFRHDRQSGYGGNGAPPESIMKILLYLFPALVNYLLGGMYFITAYRFSVAGASGVVVGASLAAWAGVYCLLSLLIGRWATVRNAPRMICGGALLMALAMLGFLVREGLYMQFLWIVLTGVGSAFYCTPFQVFAKSLESDASAGVVRTVAFYNFSWSFGMATGPFLFSFIPARVGFGVNFILTMAMALGILLLDRHARRRLRKPAPADAAPCELPSETHAAEPDFAWVSWTVCGLGVVAVCVVRAMWPYRGAVLAIDKAQVARVLALVSYAQAFTVLLLFRSRNWFYRTGPIGWIGTAGVAGLLGLALSGWLGWAYLGALLFGIYSGCLFFCFVYYSLCHPTKAPHYIAVNEAVSGTASFIGPLFGGWLAECAGSAMPFLMAAAMVLVATVLHCLVTARLAVRR